MNPKEKIIEGMKLIKEGCFTIDHCYDCPFEDFCDGVEEIESWETEKIEGETEEKPKTYVFSGIWSFTVIAKSKEEAIKMYDEAYIEDIDIDDSNYNLEVIED